MTCNDVTFGTNKDRIGKSKRSDAASDFRNLSEAVRPRVASRRDESIYVASQKAEGWVLVPDRYDDGGYSGGTLERPALMAGRTLIIRVPLPPRRRGGRKFIVGPGGLAWTGRRVVVDNTIIKALGRAHRWKAMLESGKYRTMTELAGAEEINLSYLCRLLRLTLLAPDIAEALLDARYMQLQLSDLLRPFPLIWAEQRDALKPAVTA